MLQAKQPVNIEGIEFDALIDEDVTLEADVPSYPVEKGFEISDGIILKPQKLSMTLFVGISVTWVSRLGTNIMRAQEVEQRLKELYFKRQPVTIITSDSKYTNMAITNISFRKSLETGYSREFPISFQEVRVTQSQTTTIPDSYGRSGATGVNAGTANITVSQTPPGKKVETDGEQSKATILYEWTYGGGLANVGNMIDGLINGGDG